MSTETLTTALEILETRPMNSAWPDWLRQASAQASVPQDWWHWGPPLSLQDPEMGTIQNDFSRLTHRCRNSKKDPLFLATENIPRRVAIDRTAGFGGDAVFLASLGFEVHAWERHPSVFVFLKETEQWAHRQGFRLTAHRGEAPDQNLRAELVLLDPMFEETGSAKPSKKMQWLRSQAAPWSQKEWDDYLNLARRQAKSRVVLKAPPSTDLPGALPTSQIEGQSFSWQILKPF